MVIGKPFEEATVVIVEDGPAYFMCNIRCTEFGTRIL